MSNENPHSVDISLGNKLLVLDHGYVQVIESWGSDERIIEAARMSTQKGFQGWGGEPCPMCKEEGRLSDLAPARPKYSVFVDVQAQSDAVNCSCKGTGKTTGDEKLLHYLHQNKHATPFEFAGLVIEVQAPIMVFREWHRHRTQSYNEMSARYTPLPDLNYLPTVGRMMASGGQVTRQAGTIAGSDELTADVAEELRKEERAFNEVAEGFYQRKLRLGVPKELARTHLGVSRFSRMRAQANLRNWLAFLTLRMAPQAQWEIRQYANLVGEIIKFKFPRTWTLFTNGRT